MNLNSLIFALTTQCYNDDSGNALFLPVLDIYASASVAAAECEGIDIVEGDLQFFSFDGLPLEAKFSKEPYINSKKNKYFRGEYSLQPGSGDSLQNTLSDILAAHGSPHAWIVFHLASQDDLAQKNGWLHIEAMRMAAEQSLKILPSDMITRIKMEG